MEIDANENDPLSPSGLKSIIDTVFRGTCSAPSTQRLQGLSDLLMAKRETARFLSEMRTASVSIADLHEKIAALQSSLLRFIPAMEPVRTFFADIQSSIDAGGSGYTLNDVVELRKTIETTEALYVAASEAQCQLLDPNKFLFRRANEEQDKFNHYAIEVANEFKEAVEEANPGVQIGMASNRGPLPRFLAAVAPLVSSETVTVGAVKARLKSQIGK